MACLDQQYSEKEGQVVVVVEDLSISDLDDSSNLDCIYCMKGDNYSVVVGFAAEEVYYKRCLTIAHWETTQDHFLDTAFLMFI